MSLISVIVPVYNVEQYIKRCVDSILKQTFTDFELILIDDGSPDQCSKICDNYALEDSRVKVIHQKNGGLSAARNTGIDYVFANSNSEWLCFIDSDDWVHEKYLEVLLNAAVCCDTAVSMCRYYSTDGVTPLAVENKLAEPILMNTENAYVSESLAVVAWGKLYHRKCFSILRYPVGKLHEDEYITYKVMFMYPEIAVVPRELYFYYLNYNDIKQSCMSVKRVNDMCDAKEEQICFFKKHNYMKAHKKQI